MGLRLARLLVRVAAVTVPPLRRSSFVREWDAELWHETNRVGGRRGGARPARHALGAFADARAIGNLRRRETRTRRTTMPDRLAGWARETRLAVRGLLRSPGFAGVAVLTLALGMGASAAIYTLLDRIVLDPLPYPAPERLVQLKNQVPGVGPGEEWHLSTAQYFYFGEHAVSFERIGLHYGFGGNIQTPEGPQRVFGWRVTADAFELIGARAHIGRLISAEDDRPGGPGVMVLSHGFWQRQFGGGAPGAPAAGGSGGSGVLGRTLTVSETPFEVIGVLEPGVRMPGGPPGVSADIWIPFQLDPAGPFGNSHYLRTIARLAAGTDAEAARAELDRLTPRLVDAFPRVYSQGFIDRYGFRPKVTPLKEAVLGETSGNLWLLFGAVGLVLVIAVTNVANLFLVRIEGRSRELAIRSALGASRGAVARYLLAEGLVLSLAGGALALLLGFWGVPVLVSIAPEGLPRLEDVGLGLETVTFTLGLVLAVGVGLAAYPLARYGRRGHAEALAGGGRAASSGPGRQRLRSGLVVAQVALALTLVVGAGLLVESLRRLGDVDTGFDPEGVLTAGLHLTPDRYETDVEIWLAYRQMLDRVGAIPGVAAAGMTQELPLGDRFACTIQGFRDQEVYQRVEASGGTTCAAQEPTTPGYFEAMGIPVIRGRGLTPADNDDPTRASVVVSRAFAERFWPGEDPIGKGVAPSGRTLAPFNEVVGVVGDVPASSVAGEPAIAIYYPVVHNPDTPGNWGWWHPSNMSLVVRTDLADPLSILPAVRRAIHEVDPTVALADPASMERVVADSMARLSFVSLLLGIAAVVALILAAVGLYGVVAYVVSRRTREIGMRIAIGAEPGAVERLFVGRSMALVAGGLAVGVALALASTRVLESLLYGVEPTEPAAFAGSAAVLAVVALVASWIPARRASRVDPVEALRAE